MSASVTFVDLTVYQRMAPLVPAYLQAYAELEPLVRKEYTFNRLVRPLTTSIEELAADLVARDSAVYAVGCYVWNVGVVRRLVEHLCAARPKAEIVLGGPQVSGNADRYLKLDRENVLIVNGEGELVFRNLLLERADRHDYTKVNGLTVVRDGQLVVTPPQERLKQLDDIPSPFLGGYIEPDAYTTTILETNRGCPYQCTFCYWGSRFGNRLYSFDEARVREEVEWIAKNKYFNVYIGDANWGILERDLELTRWFAACKAKHGMPRYVQAPSAKKKGDRVAEIGKTFVNGGLSSAQALAMQSTNPTALKLVKRGEIGLKVYQETQQVMNEADVDTYVELIWPLPGETLVSFRSGLGALCRDGASSFHVFPLLLLPSTEMNTNREQLGLRGVYTEDPAGEYEIVVETKTVTPADYVDGLWFTTSVILLHNARTLVLTARYLEDSGMLSMEQLFTEFVKYCLASPDAPWTRFNVEALRMHRHVEFTWEGKLAHIVLHEARDAFDRFLYAFASEQPWWKDETARFVFELDLFNRPIVYSNTPLKEKTVPLEHVRAKSIAKGYVLDLPERFLPVMRALTSASLLRGEPSTRVALSYGRQQMPYVAKAGLDHNATYCQGAILRVRSIMPVWQPARLA